MPNKTVKLAGSRSFQDIGTVGQNAEQLAGNMQSVNQIMDVGLRNSKNFIDSWIRVSDLVALGFVTLNGDTLTAATFGGGSGTVSVQDSISGDGSPGSPLQLVGDVATPGSSFYYGTNGAGTKGWYALSAGSSPLTTKGDLFGHSTVDARIAVGTNGQVLTADSTAAVGVSWQTPGGGTTPIPATIPDLMCWFEFDNILGTSGKFQIGLYDRTPWAPSVRAVNVTSTVTVAAAQLNSLNVLQWPAAVASGNMTIAPGIAMNGGGTYFVLMKAANPTVVQAIISGGSHAMTMYLGVGTPNLNIVDGGVAVMGVCSAAWTPGTWFQANVTYDAPTGNWAFRQARVAANSGTYATSPATVGTVPCTQFANENGTVSLDSSIVAAFLAYNRVLSPTEITTVENYLFAKWGV